MRDTGRLTAAMPMPLTQSGIGVVSRLPVFPPDASDNTVFWGFTKVACRLSDLLHGVALSDLERCGYRYELWSMESDTDRWRHRRSMGLHAPQPSGGPDIRRCKVAGLL